MTHSTFIRLMSILPALLLAASCGRENAEVRPYGEDTRVEIRFAASAVTKAFASADLDALVADGFNTACILSSGVRMFDEKIIWDKARKLFVPSSGSYYYPDSGTLSFYASYPASHRVSIDRQAVTMSYTQNGQTDLLAAKAEGVTAQNDPVALEMSHILSLLHFKAAGCDDAVTYKVTGLAVTSPLKGTYDYTTGLWSVEGSETASCLKGSVTLEGTADLGVPLSVLPCKAAICVDWETWQGEVKTAEYSRKVTMSESLAPGEECTVTLKLGNDESKPLEFMVNINPWTGTDKEIDIR